MTSNIQVLAMVCLFGVLLLMGSLCLLPLFKFDWQRLLRSQLFIKTLMWIPLFVGFVAILYMNAWPRLGVALALDALAYRELHRQLVKRPRRRTLLLAFYTSFVLCSLSIPLAGIFFDKQQTVRFLVTVCFASALSDVTAFFFGNYLGHHKLPKTLNNRKSWEGVAGQLLGALLGVGLLKAFGIGYLFWLWLPIGFGTALGDLANSFVKRRLDIKDWGASLPGHGGYLDRFSSLFAGLALGCYALVLLG